METVWKMRGGYEIPIREMDDKHLLNAFALLRRKGFVGHKTVAFYVSGPLPLGEAAQDAFDSEFDYVMSAPVHESYDVLEEEIKRRGLKY